MGLFQSKQDTEETSDNHQQDTEETSDNHQQSWKKEDCLVTVSVKWSELDEPIEKPITELQFSLQSWFNRNHRGKSCSTLRQSHDGNFIVKIEPSTWSEFEQLNGQTLTRKDRDKTVTITSINGRSPQQKKQTSEGVSVNLHLSYKSQPDGEEMDEVKQNGSSVTVADSTAEELTCVLPVPYFWYMSHIYKEQLQHIEKVTRVKIIAKVKVKFGSNGDQRKALCDFTDLTQKFLHEFSLKAVPGKCLHLEAWSNTKKIIQKSDNKVLVTVSSEEMIICGTSKSQEAIMESMNAPQNLNRSVGESAGADEDTLPKTDMNINDPLVTTGLNVNEERNGSLLNMSVKWSELDGPSKKTKTELQLALQSWFNKNKKGTTCSILSQSHDGNFMIKIEPSTWSDFQQLNGQTLTRKRGRSVTITSINGRSPQQETQTSEAASVNLHPSSKLQKDDTDMNINDPLVTAGLTVNEKCWKLIAASYDGHLDSIRYKFGVDFYASQSDVHKDKVDVKVRSRRPRGNASMESHAARALLRLCQKIQTSPIPLTHLQGASGFSGSLQNRTHGSKPEGQSTDLVFNAQLVSGKDKDEAAREDEKCCICMDTFTDKRRLKCKHEFCSECLRKSEEYLGPFCPVCRDVFGVIEGNQPDGQMTWRKYTLSLPGFFDCGTIEIYYNIPSGKQTDKHPSPGQFYHGINRIAYLPDNKQGNEVLHLLKRAFDQKLIFTVGSSRTTGLDNQVTWNNIHHKTSPSGGPQRFGYPDPDYLFRVKEELKAKGIK